MPLKYKQLTKLKDINRISSRVLNFKRPKWIRIKSTLYSKISKGIFSSIYNQTDSFTTVSFWNKISKNYKENVNTQRKYNYVFGKKLNVVNTKNKLRHLSLRLIPFYSPSIIFSLYGLTNSKNHSKQKCFNKKFYLNNEILYKNDTILNSGDIIKMIDEANLLINYNKFNVVLNVSMCEFDVYSQQFIFVKNSNQLSKEDIENIMFENIKLF